MSGTVYTRAADFALAEHRAGEPIVEIEKAFLMGAAGLALRAGRTDPALFLADAANAWEMMLRVEAQDAVGPQRK